MYRESEYLVTVLPNRRMAAAATSAVEAQVRAEKRATHSPDFASVNWYGTQYAFNQTQAGIVSILWNAWENEAPDVNQRTLLREADSSAEDVRDLFRAHRAWDTMIRRSSKCGGIVGCIRLVEPREA